MSPPRATRRLPPVAAIALILAGCAGVATATDAPGSGRQSTSPAVTTSSTGASALPPATAEDGAAPPELAGTWRRSFEGDRLLLTLRGTSYTVQGVDTGAGRISVDGDRITFSDSNRCAEGSGTYTWTVEEDGRLRFTPVGDDPCGRADFLPRATWGPVEP